MHDSSSALVRGGKIIATAEEERFSRVRHHKGYPHSSSEYCLKSGGITIKDVDYIAVPYSPWAFLKHPSFCLEAIARNIFNAFVCWYYKKQTKSKTTAKVIFVPHHLSHAASAYYCSGFDKANILTIDGSGETESFAFFIGENGKIRRIWDIPISPFFIAGKSQSIGLIYTSVTSLLNLGVNGEGKTMGLASYGKPVYDFSEILNIRAHDDYSINRRILLEKYGYLQRKEGEHLSEEHKNLAASLQDALEKSIINLAREAFEYSGIKNFCLAGGVALNCNTNSEILKQNFCDSIFIQPASNDGGIALGAALEVASSAREQMNARIDDAYFGPEFDSQYIEKILIGSKVNFRKSENISAEVARLVCDGKMVGWFQGRMEMGPRALGNRSILADPTLKGINDKVNEYVKHRESWRPFAPSVAEDSAGKYFEGLEKAKSSPFMLHTFFVKKEYQDKLPAITHIDGSSRIQTVKEDQNKKYYELLKEIEKINGYAMVLNTSFNDKGEPIICSPQDALRCFYSTGLDALAIGDYIIEKHI